MFVYLEYSYVAKAIQQILYIQLSMQQILLVVMGKINIEIQFAIKRMLICYYHHYS